MQIIARQGGERITRLWQRVHDSRYFPSLFRRKLSIKTELTSESEVTNNKSGLATEVSETQLLRRRAIDVAYGRDINGNTFLTAKDRRMYTGLSHPKTLRATPFLTEAYVIDSGRLWPDFPHLGIVVNSKSYELNVPHGGAGREVTVEVLRELVAGHRPPIHVRSA